MHNNSIHKQKKYIEIVFSERGDFWIEDMLIDDGESIAEALKKQGYQKFIVDTVDAYDPNAVQDGMHIRVKIMD